MTRSSSKKKTKRKTTLEDAILLAVKAHRGHVDKAGQPYILHPFRVVFRLASDEERIAGMLHDAIEESNITLGHLRRLGFSKEVVEALDHLTWRKTKESYPEYIERVRLNPLAVAVKIADLQDHLAPSIDGGPTFLQKNHPDLYNRYREALSRLGKWKLLGRDGFDREAGMYLMGEYGTETAALQAAYKRLEELEQLQPTSQSGGQAPEGIQDRVFIKSPDGNLERILPPTKHTGYVA